MGAWTRARLAALGLLALTGIFFLQLKSQPIYPSPTKPTSMALTYYTEGPVPKCAPDIFFVICVHSAPLHLPQRQLIRQTMGTVTTVKVRVVFFVGKAPALVETSLARESREHPDLVRGPFVDSYRNLTYKHLTVLRWASTECPNAKYLLKVDDDAFVDLEGLFTLLRVMYPAEETLGTDRMIACSLHPSGGAPLRGPDGGKWMVSYEEVPRGVLYPKYCEGLAYVTTPKVAKDLLDAVPQVPFLWIDDLYVTGLLANRVQARHHSLNIHTTHETKDLLRWLDGDSRAPCPFLIAELPPNQSQLLERLWRKTVSARSREGPLQTFTS